MYSTDAVVDGFIQRFEAAQILARIVKPGNRCANTPRAAAVYPRNDAELVSCHNDLKPQNMLFDGNRVLLVDWEAAFLNDRYFDLAVVGNFFVKDPADEEHYLHAYFGEPAGEYRSARFFLKRQTLHVFYAACFLLLASKTGLLVDPAEAIPDFRDFHQRLISGETDLDTAEAKRAYGMIHLREAVKNMRTPRFEEALVTVASSAR